MNSRMMFTRAAGECCQCENVASTKSNTQFVYAKATVNKLEIGNTGIGNTSTMATFSKVFAQIGDKCCQCENVVITKSNFQFVYAKATASKLEIGNIGIGNTSTMATFTKMFAAREVFKAGMNSKINFTLPDGSSVPDDGFLR